MIVAGNAGEGVAGGLDDTSRAAVAHHGGKVPGEGDTSSTGAVACSAVSPSRGKSAGGAAPQTLSSHQNRSSHIGT